MTKHYSSFNQKTPESILQTGEMKTHIFDILQITTASELNIHKVQTSNETQLSAKKTTINLIILDQTTFTLRK